MTFNKPALIGGFVGFLIFFYDYDFFLNFGGPSTPISNFISNFFHFQDKLFFPALFLILFGSAMGFLFEKIFNKK